VEKEWIIKSA
jgi:hypothetical protein